MNIESAFWDSSALVPLCTTQLNSRSAVRIAEGSVLVVWWAARVKIESAIARLWRNGELTNHDKQAATDALITLIEGWREIAPTIELRELAQTLLHRHPLRAADSLQLAAAITWCRHKPGGRRFVASDARLCEAAALSGFLVLEPRIPE